MDLESTALRFAATYNSANEYNVPSCGFSKCGNYFAFVDSPSVAVIYPLQPLRKCCNINTLSPAVENPISESNGADTGVDSPWRIICTEPREGHNEPTDIKPLCRIQTSGTIQCITFAAGNVSRCRLPHRTKKRMSRVVQGSEVSLFILGLIHGVIEVYNISDLNTTASRVPMILYADHRTIFVVKAAPDASLRLASVHSDGDVKLWDLWDDGNMYSSLKTCFSLPNANDLAKNRIYGEACTFAWQPYGQHICVGGQGGYGIILQSEKPFHVVSFLHPGHLHRISAASYTHDGSLLLTASYDSSCIVWSVPDYVPLYRYWHMGSPPRLVLLGGMNGHHLYGLAIAPDDLTFVTICEDRCVRLWSLLPTASPAKAHLELPLPTASGLKLRSVAFSECGRLILVSTSDSRLLVFTNPSHLLSLTLQCLRVLRRCLVCHLQNNLDSQTGTNVDSGDGEQQGLFHRAVSSLNLPSKLLPLVLREFSVSDTGLRPQIS